MSLADEFRHHLTETPQTVADLVEASGQEKKAIYNRLRELQELGHAKKLDGEGWVITSKGAAVLAKARDFAPTAEIEVPRFLLKRPEEAGIMKTILPTDTPLVPRPRPTLSIAPELTGTAFWIGDAGELVIEQDEARAVKLTPADTKRLADFLSRKLG